MRCQHCGAVLEDLDALQTHQVTACPAIASDEDSILVPPDEPEQVEVEFKWLEDRIVPDHTQAIHLIISSLDFNIELNKCNGSFKADGVQINTGTYNGQLVIGNDILPLSEFVINQQSETIFLIIDRDSSQLTTTEQEKTSANAQPVESEDELPEDSPRDAGFNVIDQSLEPMQSENSAMGNLLSEESFLAATNQQAGNTSPKFDEDQHYTFSPDDPTLQNIETLDLDLSPRREHFPSEHQQPLENDIRDPEQSAGFSQLSGNSTPRSDGGSADLSKQGNDSNVEQILHELSMTDQEEDRGDPLLEHRSLPQAPSQQYQARHENAFTSFLSENKSRGSEPDILPSRLKTRSSDLSRRQQKPNNNYDGDTSNGYTSPTERSPVERIRRRSSDGNSRHESRHGGSRRSRSSSGSRQVDMEGRSPRGDEDPEKDALRAELKRLQDLTENYKEVKEELEVKCRSYDEEVERLKKKNEQLEQFRKKELENVKEIKNECDAKCESYESEVARLKEKCNEVIDTLQKRTDKEAEVVNEIKEEYATKCQSHEDEIDRLNEKCNQLLGALQRKTDDNQEQMQPPTEEKEELQAKVLSYQQELDRLTSKCSDLEGLRKKTSIMTQKDERVKNIQRINELEAKCASYDEEMTRLKQHCFQLEQQGRQNALVAAKRRPSDDDDDDLKNILKTTELQAKCESYDNELKRLQSACRELKTHIKKEQELRRASEEEKKMLEIRIDACNEELHKLGNKCRQQQQQQQRSPEQYSEGLIAKHREENLMSQQIITELEAKCQSYDMETERLKRENGKCKEKYSKAKEYLRGIATQQSRFELENQAIKEENQRLKGENESLEMVRKLREKDVEDEKKTFETSLDKLKKENERLKKKLLDLSTSSVPDYKLRENLVKLKQGNEKLRRDFNHITTAVNPASLRKDDSDDDSAENNYEPKIISPRHQSTFLPSASSSGKYSNNSKMTFVNLPDKHKRTSDEYFPDKHKRMSDEYEDQNRSYDNRSYDYRSYSTKQQDDTKRNKRHNHRYTPPENNRYTSPENGYTTSSRTNIDDIMKRYSNGNDLLSTKETSSSSSYHRRRGSLTENVDSIGRHFGSGTMESRLPPKAWSYDHGMDRLLDDDNDGSALGSPRSINSPTRANQALIPFSPVHSKDLAVGMKVCVTRSNGRTSRGITKWIGTLPNTYGDFVGVELDTESGKHDGIFENVRYFRCKRNRGVFVKFSKVIMGWR